MTIDDVDIVEINEAFAAQIVPCRDELGIPEDKLNPFGGAIALGHPFGMTGARIMTTLLNGLDAVDGRYGDRVDVRRGRHGPGDARRAARADGGEAGHAGDRHAATGGAPPGAPPDASGPAAVAGPEGPGTARRLGRTRSRMPGARDPPGAGCAGCMTPVR